MKSGRVLRPARAGVNWLGRRRCRPPPPPRGQHRPANGDRRHQPDQPRLLGFAIQPEVDPLTAKINLALPAPEDWPGVKDDRVGAAPNRVARSSRSRRCERRSAVRSRRASVTSTRRLPDRSLSPSRPPARPADRSGLRASAGQTADRPPRRQVQGEALKVEGLRQGAFDRHPGDPGADVGVEGIGLVRVHIDQRAWRRGCAPLSPNGEGWRGGGKGRFGTAASGGSRCVGHNARSPDLSPLSAKPPAPQTLRAG